MRLTRSRAAVAAAASFVFVAVVGCGAHDYPPSPVNAVLTDREAVRLAELHLNEIDPQASPRDVVSVEPTHEGKGHLVGFHTFFDETQRAPKTSRLVVVEHDGDVREMRFPG